MPITHAKVSAVADGGDAALVQPSNWNAGHAFDGQLAFPAVASPSADVNTLDDYEEGTWTPDLTFATPGDTSVAYTSQEGLYIRCGSLCVAQFSLVTSAFTHTTASGAVTIQGLPFTIMNTTADLAYGSLVASGWTDAAYSDLSLVGLDATTTVIVQASRSASTIATAGTAQFATGASIVIRGSIAYAV